jgi:hypothetical protein
MTLETLSNGELLAYCHRRRYRHGSFELKLEAWREERAKAAA